MSKPTAKQIADTKIAAVNRTWHGTAKERIEAIHADHEALVKRSAEGGADHGE